MKYYIVLLFIVVSVSSCVTAKKFNEQKALADKYLALSNDCSDKLNKNMADLADLQAQGRIADGV